LGKSHRHCPQCGAAQDPEKRYFPPEGEEVAVVDHIYVGADWSCSACESPNAKNAAFCINCGADEQGSQAVDLIEEESPVAVSPTAPLKKKRRHLLVVAVVVAIFSLVATFFLWTEEKTVTVSSHSWERSIAVERYKQVSSSAWKEKLPADAYGVRCERKQQSTKKIPDGETCKTVKRDQGDGTYRTEQKCTARYRTEPVYGDHCHYKVDRWQKQRTARSSGSDTKPLWPEPVVQTCTGLRLGCERMGGRQESYQLHFHDAKGEEHSCPIPHGQWHSAQVGSSQTIEFRVIGGGPACATLRPL